MSFQPADLHVIAVLNNPVRFQSRLRLFRDFRQRMLAAGVHLITVEAAFWDRHFEVTSPHHLDDLQLVQKDELWQKERMINLGMEHLSAHFPKWEYVAWIDGDVEFVRPDWPMETIHQLQNYQIVQMFQTAIDMGPTSEAFQTYNGFGYSFAQGLPKWNIAQYPYEYGGKYWHSGYAWAANRQTIDDLGGLLDCAILGAGDHHMALSMIGDGDRSVPKGLHPNYLKHVQIWQDRCARHLRQDIGYVPGTLLHHWHGKKIDRRYWDRWAILKKWQYDPDIDLKRDSQGLWVFSDQGVRLRNDLRAYFRARKEDSIDLV